MTAPVGLLGELSITSLVRDSARPQLGGVAEPEPARRPRSDGARVDRERRVGQEQPRSPGSHTASTVKNRNGLAPGAMSTASARPRSRG